MDTPYAHFVIERTSSTQDDARRLLDEHGRVVVATHHQTAGRGRRARTWLNATRVLAVSVGFRPDWPSETWPRFTLVAGLAARDVLGTHIGLKWPNDLVIEGAKIGGLLAEAVDDRLVIGLGVNLFWENPPAGMSSLFDEDPGPESIGEMSREFADALFDRASAGPDGWQPDEYRRASVTLGRAIRWEPHGIGIAVDVAADGGLVVDVEGRLETISSGEVWYVRGTDPPNGP